jgi:type IV secretion system protein VirB9
MGQGLCRACIAPGLRLTVQFDGVPGGRAFAIKPAASGVATNITVYTNRRSYYFHVVEARETPHYVVQFRYPEARVQPARAVAADAPNANYAVSSSREFTPTAIWDDGTFTYFRFARNAPVPAIFRYTNGGERAVNSTVLSDGVIRVSGVNRQWVLRLGDAEVCVQDMGAPTS